MTEAGSENPANLRLPWASRLVEVARDIKLAHSVFALPFAVLAMVLASRSVGRWPSLIEVALIVLCMVAARTAAMVTNRLADASLDAANPRTAGRALPAGRVRRADAWGVLAVSAAVYFAGAAGFGIFGQAHGGTGTWWPLMLSAPVLAWLMAYSFTKRFTWLCHVHLGIALALSPVAAALAIEPAFVGYAGTGVPWLLAGMVAGWVAGFDVIYALQDVETDRDQNLYSMPSRLGEGRALAISAGLHVLCALFLLGVIWRSETLGAFFMAASVATIALLIVEHAIIHRSGTRRLNMAFFTINGVISVILGIAGVIDQIG